MSKNQRSHTFVASSCAKLMSTSPTFETISSLNPTFFVNLGDMHYSARNTSTKDQFVFAYHEVLKSKPQRHLYQTTPLVYTFDDHDVGDNNADALSHSSSVVNEVYRVRTNTPSNLVGAHSALQVGVFRHQRHPAQVQGRPSSIPRLGHAIF